VSLTEKESRRMVELKQVMTMDQAYALVMILHQAVEKCVTDKVLRSQIAGEIEQKLRLNLGGLPARITEMGETADLSEFSSD
jgi:hypothetical protein